MFKHSKSKKNEKRFGFAIQNYDDEKKNLGDNEKIVFGTKEMFWICVVTLLITMFSIAVIMIKKDLHP